MNSEEELFQKVKDSKNTEILNNFLIELSKMPKLEYLIYIDYFINEYPLNLLQKLNISLIHLLGKIGKIEVLEKKYIDYMCGEYFKSDRWIRNEILISIEMIITRNRLPENINTLLKDALVDDYLPIKINVLSIIMHLDEIPRILTENLIRVLNTNNSEQLDKLANVLKKNFYTEKQLFELLNLDKMYKVLTKIGLRSLLLIYFKSIINLESFRNLIENSNWDHENKEMIFKEIHVFQKILINQMY